MPSVEYRKLKITDDQAYLSFLTLEGLQKGLETFNGLELKNKKLAAKHVAEESIVVSDNFKLSILSELL